MADSRPIGIFDSGIGGIAIARQIRDLLPYEKIIYVADTHHAPYGEKTEACILQRSLAITDFLLSRGVKAIVVACNTATMISIKALRERYALPIIGVEPGIKPAALNSKTGVIGVLATSKTLVSQAFIQLAERVASHVTIEVQPCPELVVLIEALKLDDNETKRVVARYVEPLLAKGADTFILGCTHFSHLKPVIERVVGPDIMVISTESAVARETRRRLESESLLTDPLSKGTNLFFSTGDPGQFQRQLFRLWEENTDVASFQSQ